MVMATGLGKTMTLLGYKRLNRCAGLVSNPQYGHISAGNE